MRLDHPVRPSKRRASRCQLACFRPSTAHAALGEAFYDVVAPAAFPQAILRHATSAGRRGSGSRG